MPISASLYVGSLSSGYELESSGTTYLIGTTQITGSMGVSGSVIVQGPITVNSDIASSITASEALHAINADAALFATNAGTALYVLYSGMSNGTYSMALTDQIGNNTIFNSNINYVYPDNILYTTASQALTASYAMSGGGSINTSSFATTGSNTFRGNQIITGSLTIGSSSLGANENTLVIGPAPAGGTGEGGQLLLQAPGGTYTSASMWDNYQNYTRLLRGTNAGSDAVVAQFNMHSKQVQFPQYNSSTAFTGTAAGYLAFDSSGNLITTTGTAGGSGTTFSAGNVDNRVITATGTSPELNGEANLTFNGTSLTVTGQITSSGAITSLANGAMYFRGGDDAEFWDINVANTVGIYGQQNADRAGLKLGSSGATLFGSASRFGIQTTSPVATLDVNGNLYVATSLTASIVSASSGITGSLFGSASYAITASYAMNGGGSGDTTAIEAQFWFLT